MIHTSIRLSEEHASRIKETGKSPTTIIKEALDAYFKMPFTPRSEDINPLRDLIEEHVRLYHKHDVLTDAHATIKPIEHEVSTGLPALSFILSELEAGREPMLSELAERFKVPAQTISKAISPYDIRAQETKRGGISGRYFTMAMKDQIEAIIARE